MSRTLLLVALSLSAVVPVAAGPALALGCEEQTIVNYITVSTPLEEQITATELLYLLVMPSAEVTRQQRHLVNGLDAYVVDLGCDVQSAQFLVTGTDNELDQYNLGVAFYSSTLALLGTAGMGEPRDVSGPVPQGSRYLVVLLEAGLPAAGLQSGLPPKPFSVRFDLQIAL